MNNERRKRIEAVQAKLRDIQAEVEAIRDDEQASYDNRSEGSQQTEAGQKSETAINNLTDIASEIENQIENLGNVEE